MGHIVELASSDELYGDPEHPYTKALLSAIPIPNPELERSKKVLPLEGEVGSPINCGWAVVSQAAANTLPRNVRARLRS